MKKITSLLLISCLMFCFTARSQNIQNLDFEGWWGPKDAKNWSTTTGISLENFHLISFEFGARSTDAHSGSYAIQLKPQSLGALGALLDAMGAEVGDIDFANMAVPAIMQLGETVDFNITMATIDLFFDFDFTNISAIQDLAAAFGGAISDGATIVSKPQYVKAWVKSSVADTITIAAFTKNGDVYMQAGVNMVNNATNWTEVTVDLNDLASGTPNKIGIIIVGGGLTSSSTTSFFIDDVTVDGHTTSILSSTPSFKIYPNPATDLVKIEMDGEYNVNMYDITGKKVVEQNNLLNASEINTSALKAGVYMLEVVQGDKIQTKKIVIE